MDPGEDLDGHRRFEEMAVAHVLGGLDQVAGRVFRAHLVECAGCRARVGELQAIAHELADVERHERNQRAAKAVETKRREATRQSSPAPGPSTRSLRLVIVVCVAAVVGLAVWNFTLRGTLSDREGVIDQLTDAATLLEFGTEATVVQETPDIDGSVRTGDGHFVLVVGGLQDAPYGVYVLDGDDAVQHSELRRPRNERIVLYGSLPAGASRLVVVRVSRDGALPASPSGSRVFEAHLAGDS